MQFKLNPMKFFARRSRNVAPTGTTDQQPAPTSQPVMEATTQTGRSTPTNQIRNGRISESGGGGHTNSGGSTGANQIRNSRISE